MTPRTRATALLTLTVLLAAGPARAAVPPSTLEAPRAARLGGPVTPGRGALLLGAQVLALAAGGAVSVALGSIWIEDDFRTHGRPDPRVYAANIAIGMAVNLALTWLLLPDLARVTNDEGGTADPGFVRREVMRRTRWIAAAGALFAGVIAIGAVIEKNDFGRGQAVLAVGAGGAALSVITFDVVSLLAVRSATETSRLSSEAPR